VLMQQDVDVEDEWKYVSQVPHLWKSLENLGKAVNRDLNESGKIAQICTMLARASYYEY
jgi:hypothetical protein